MLGGQDFSGLPSQRFKLDEKRSFQKISIWGRAVAYPFSENCKVDQRYSQN
jgi:hypothetical protein